MLARSGRPGLISRKGAPPALDWDPANYGTVIAWYNETSAITGTTDVTQWNDISGNGRHATRQGTGTYDSTVAAVNGKRVMKATNGRGMMIPSASQLTSAGAALIAFVEVNPLVDLHTIFGNANSGASADLGFAVRTRVTQSDYLAGVNNAGTVWLTIGGGSAAAAGAITVVLISWDGAVPRLDLRTRRNAFVTNREDLTASGSAPATANGETRFGGLAAGNAFNGTLCEAVAWAGALSAANQASALSAVATRWGLAL